MSYDKGELEKLIDWELDKQLFWAAVLLSATVGVAGILVVNSIASNARVFVIGLGLTLMLVINMSFYRLATSLVNLRRYIERIGDISYLYKEELNRNVIFASLYRPFVNTTEKFEPHLRIWLVLSIIIIADLFILLWIFIGLA